MKWGILAHICCSWHSELAPDICHIRPTSAAAKTDMDRSRNVRNVKERNCRDLGALPVFTPVYTWTTPAESRCGVTLEANISPLFLSFERVYLGLQALWRRGELC